VPLDAAEVNGAPARFMTDGRQLRSPPMSEPLKLYAESTFMSPWVFHVMVALEEMGLPYKVEVVPLPIPPATKAELQKKSVIGKVPILVDGDVWITESLAITEYLGERFPQAPRLYPADLVERARARQVLSMLRSSLFALREDRSTASVFGRPVAKPFSDKGKLEAAELVRVAEALIQPGATSMFGAWCIADADLALCLMRLVAHQDPMPQHVVDYAIAQFDRKSVRKFVSHLPTVR
jgi:glutathione S-transferase